MRNDGVSFGVTRNITQGITFLNRCIRGPKGMTCSKITQGSQYTEVPGACYPLVLRPRSIQLAINGPQQGATNGVRLMNPGHCFLVGRSDFVILCDGLPHRIGLI